MSRPAVDGGGSQSARKVLVLLKHVAAHHPDGVRLTDLVERSGFDKSTIHRLLGLLVDEGFIERVPSSKRYRLGIDSVQLGFAAPRMEPILERFRPVLYRLSRMSQDTVFLVARSGDFAVYVHRQDGTQPVKAFVADAERRRLLGFSAVGVCMLARDSDEAIASSHARHAQAYLDMGMTLAVLREHVQFARRHGYSELRDFGPANTAGVGYAFPLSAMTMAGVSIAGVRDRMAPARMRELGQLLQHELAPLAHVA